MTAITRKLLTQLNKLPCISSTSGLPRSLLWGTLSKASSQSRYWTSITMEDGGLVGNEAAMETNTKDVDSLKKEQQESVAVVKEEPKEAVAGGKEGHKDAEEVVKAEPMESAENGKKSEEQSNGKASTESDIGITEYLGKHAGFFGILKQRYSDFVVNEVSNNGEVVHLTDREIPPVPEEPSVAVPEETPPQLTPDVLQQLEDLVGIPRPARIPIPTIKISKCDAEDNESKVSEAMEVAQETNPQVAKDPKEVMINVNGVTKEGRGIIHQSVKGRYKSLVSYYKEDDNGDKFIVVTKKNASGTNKRSAWPKNCMYTTFVLYKENMDTMDAISHMANKIRMKPNMFAYAGTKDRRGKTSQVVSVSRVPPERLCHAVKYRSIHLGNFRFLPTPQKLGQLKGNKFHIVLREVKEEDDVIISSIESLKKNGFINYFGSQRFGTTSVSTHSIGLELLRSNWEKAVNLILAPRDNDRLYLNQCRLVWKETGSAEEALRVLRGDREASIEGRLLMGLKQYQKNDFVNALSLIPRNMRVLYLHAYQSYIWNKVASRRIAKYGLSVLPGDIIRRKDAKNVKIEDCEESGNQEEEDNEDDEKESEKDGEEQKEKSGIDSTHFHILSEEEAKTTPITEVLLPLPGYRIQYPQNEIKEWFLEYLEADGLSLASLNHKVKAYSVTGGYRRLVGMPSDVTSSITYYDDPTKPLIQSDLDVLSSISVEDNLLKEGQNKAVIIQMTLPASTYATMALRELLKMDTSSSFQATLNTIKPDVDAHARSQQRDGGRKYHGDGNRTHQYHDKKGFHTHSRGRGEKRPWRGSHNRGGKRGRFSRKKY